MKSFNNNEMDFQEKLQKDTEIPVIVHERINQAYRMIENDTAMQKKTPKEQQTEKEISALPDQRISHLQRHYQNPSQSGRPPRPDSKQERSSAKPCGSKQRRLQRSAPA